MAITGTIAPRAIATINLSAIKANYLFAKSLSKQTIAVIKADAYGHGAVKVALSLADVADMFAVASLTEAIELRDHNIKQPILLLAGLLAASELSLIIKYNLHLVVVNFKQIKWLNTCHKPLNLFLKYDTGMHRLGFSATEITTALMQIEHHNITLMSHFAAADDLISDYTQTQIKQFDNFANKFNYPSSLANSAAILRQITNDTINRAGIMLYGVAPIDKYQPKLTPAMSLTAPLIAITKLSQGDKIGYGNTYTCLENCTIGIVAIGYADGYPRHAKNGTAVFLNGTKCKLVGRVSMDMISIDLSTVPNPQFGDRVELFGANILANELAQNSNTISYEIFTRITNRVQKIYQN